MEHRKSNSEKIQEQSHQRSVHQNCSQYDTDSDILEMCGGQLSSTRITNEIKDNYKSYDKKQHQRPTMTSATTTTTTTSATTTTHNFSSEVLIRSCPLPKSMISHKGRSHHTLTITASIIEPLSSYLKKNKKHIEYQVIEKLIDDIGRQLQKLEREDMGVSSFNIDDITVFHNNDHDHDHDHDIHFAITNDDKIHEINEEHQLVIDTPYANEYTASPTNTTKNKAFHSPEFKEFISQKKVPYHIHFKSGYYSFGLLCLYCYVSRATTTAATTTTTDLDKILAPILHTKIYWFLKQVLQENPTSRRYICV